MRAAIYNPYWDTLGGGERYTISVADVLSRHGYKVDIAWRDATLIKQIETRFGMKTKDLRVVPDINKGRDYDVCFWVSDGSVPLLYARKNILHFQIPFRHNQVGNLMNRMKFFRINKVICNSNFTKSFIDRSFGINSDVLYPPVDVSSFKPKKKEKIILYVGRFSELTQAKRQDVLIESFKKLYDSGSRDWKLVLAGGVEVGVGDYLSKLKEMSIGYPITFLPSPKFSELVALYGRAKFFWSAAGYEIDSQKEPKKVEHFGITLVEAMSAKCVPLVYDAGGHREIVSTGENGILWKSTSELIKHTKSLIKDTSDYRDLASRAQSDSENFSKTSFEQKILSFL